MNNELITAKEFQNHIVYTQAMIDITSKLDEAEVPYTLHKLFNGYKLLFPWCDGDVIAHEYAPTKLGKVESMNFSWDGDDVTVMDPEAMAIMIIAEYVICKISK